MSTADRSRCDLEALSAHALGALGRDEARGVEEHLATCAACARELAALRRVAESLADWSAGLLQPSPALRDRLLARIDAAADAKPRGNAAAQWSEPAWEEAAPGISCKLLATDAARDRVTMLVRLAPGVSYPPHRHAGVEELHLLEGELWIEDRKLLPGDYNRGEPGTADRRVFSETGCMCLLITSPSDALG